MPSPIRSKTIFLISLRTGEIEKPLCVTSTFRKAYKIALFEQRIAMSNINERTALSILNKSDEKKVYLWDKDSFEYEDEARWSPVGKMVLIQKILIK
jgi:hypothetical protein